MNSAEYISVLKEQLIPEFIRAKNAIPGTWRLMQDIASCHTAGATKAFLRRKRVEMIEWPPYSPDLNLIENLWQ
jgi:transposase